MCINLLNRIFFNRFFMKSSIHLPEGNILQIIGPVMDISFPSGKMPNIYNSLLIVGKTECLSRIYRF